MTDQPDRNYAQEAKEILAGTSMMQPEKAHLEALEESHQVSLIKLANSLEQVKREALNG